MFQPVVKSRVGEDISILVKLENHPWFYLCECGDASDLTVSEIQNCNAIFISHTHIDHFVNFDAVIRHQIGIQRRVVICGPKGIALQVQARIQSYTWNLIQKGAIVYEIREYELDQKINVYEIEPPLWELKEIETITGNTIFKETTFSVNAILLDHKIPVLAYQFKEFDSLNIELSDSGLSGGRWVKELKEAFLSNDTQRLISVNGVNHQAETLFHLLHINEGDSVGIIMDHAASEENHEKIKDHFFKARTVFIECFYKEADKENALVNFHSYSNMSAKVMREAEVLEPIPVHFSRRYDQNEIDDLITEFETELARLI